MEKQDLMKMLLSSTFNRGGNRNHVKFSFDSYVRGYHVYKDVWSPLIGEECFECRYEKGNEQDEFAIAVYLNDLCQDIIVGHIPHNLSKAVFKFLQLPTPKFKTTLQSDQKASQQRCRLWSGNSSDIHFYWIGESHILDREENI